MGCSKYVGRPPPGADLAIPAAISCANPNANNAEKIGALPQANSVCESTNEKSGASAFFGHTACSNSNVVYSAYHNNTNVPHAAAPAVVRAFMKDSNDNINNIPNGK